MTDSGTVTLLFTDLVNSTELVSRTGGESAQRIFDAHHKLLSDAVSASGGQEVKWLGDGVMVAFLSADAALSRAIVAESPALDLATRLPDWRPHISRASSQVFSGLCLQSACDNRSILAD